MNLSDFQSLVKKYYAQNKRDLPWRHNPTLYRVCVSEFMLQQTQVSRVINYFLKFMAQFSSFEELSQARLSQVLASWQGLGYNRRAKYLWKTAEKIAIQAKNKQYSKKELMEFPGIGEGTAGAIIAYVYNVPIVFIETNIRTVFIHHFFKNKPKIADTAIIPLIEKTLDKKNPRQWYWALMDYGTYLKQQGAHNRTSAQYSKQSKFNGSLRQVRGRIIAHLLNRKPISYMDLCNNLKYPKKKIQKALEDLLKEGLIAQDKQRRYCCI